MEMRHLSAFCRAKVPGFFLSWSGRFFLPGLSLVIFPILGLIFPEDGLSNPSEKCAVGCFRSAFESAKMGSGEAENRMGTMFSTGAGAPYDPSAAAAWFLKAASKGHSGASLNLGMLYLTGEGVGEDVQQAHLWIQKAATQGNNQASHLLGLMYEKGMGVVADAAAASRWYKLAGEQGNLAARADWVRLARVAWPENPPPRVAAVEKTVRPGETRPQKSATTPEKSTNKSAQKPSERGGGATDPARKVESPSRGDLRVQVLLEKTRSAAVKGDTDAQNRLGVMYLSGLGVSNNPREAFRWFEMAARAGAARAQYDLAKLYLKGEGVARDVDRAVDWLEKAAERNHPEAQLLLATLLEKGEGLETDKVEALKWYGLASDQGVGDAVRAQKRLMVSMPGNDVGRAVQAMNSFRNQGSGITTRPREIQLASLSLDSVPVPESGQRTKRGVARPSTVVAAVDEDKLAPKTQPPSPLDAWEKKVDDGGKGLSGAAGVKEPYVLLLATPAVKAVDAKGQKAAEDGLKQAMDAERNKDVDAMRKHLVKAFEQDPTNLEVLKRLGLSAMDSGNPLEALPYFRAAAHVAVLKGQLQDVALVDGRITEIVSMQPPWVEEKLMAAGVVKPDKASVASTWSNLLEQALSRAQGGDLPQAVSLGQQALDLSKKNFGEEHTYTILSQRELGSIQLQNGNLDGAEVLFKQSAETGKKILGDSHPETLAAMTLLAELKESRMQLEGAVAGYREVAESYGKGFGPSSPLKLQADQSLARVLKNQGNAKEGEKILRENCSLVAKTFGFYHPDTAACLQQYAEVQRAAGNFDAARSEIQQALSIFTGVLPKGDPRVVAARVVLGGVYRDSGKFAEAKSTLLTVNDEIKANPNDLGFLQVDVNTALSRVYLDMGDLEQAQNLTSTLYQEHKAKFGPGHPTTLAALADLAGIKEKKGLTEDADKYLNEALAGYKKLFGEAHPTTITVINNLGQMMEAAGLYDNAEPILRKAVSLSEQVYGKSHPTTLTIQNNLALLHESQGSFDKAEPLYQQAIEAYSQTLGPKHSDTVAVINNLAYLYLLKQDYSKALPLFEKVFSLWQETLGDMHQRTLKALNNMARTNHKLGKMQQAEGLFKKALSQRTKAMGPRHMDTLRSMHDLASLYHDMGRDGEALELLKKTLTLDDQVLGKNHPYTFETLNTMANVLEKKSDMEGAYQVRQEGFARRTEFLNRMLWASGDDAREGYVRLHRPELDGYLALLSQMDAATAGREVLDISLKRKGILLKVTSEIQQVIRLTRDPQLEAIAEDLTKTRKELAALTLSGPSPETVDSHLQSIQALEDKVSTLQLGLGQASKRFRRSASDVPVAKLVEHLPNDAALVDFLIYREGDREKMVAGLLIKNKDQAQFSLVTYPDVERIQKSILNYRKVIQDEDAESSEVIETGQEVYDFLWRPIAKVIGVRQNVYLVPDGVLNILPFPALVDEKEQYLTQTTDLHMLGSSRDLVPSDVPPATGQFLILAGPDYNFDKIVAANIPADELQRKRSASLKTGLRAFSSGMRGLRFDPLPGAEKEGELISGISKGGKKGSRMLLKNEAQEQVISSLSEPPEVLHIATHGFFLKPDDNLRKRLLKLQRGADVSAVPPGDNPMLRSGLAFAGINSNAQLLGEIDTDNDGVLTALEVMGRDFSGTRLVVLSACETGLGEIHEGEGVYGLRRSFQEAGVQAVVSSLWEVSDAGTQELMSGMYQRMSQGMDAHRALRESQLKMIGSREWSMPYVWSAFMMMGQ